MQLFWDDSNAHTICSRQVLIVSIQMPSCPCLALALLGLMSTAFYLSSSQGLSRHRHSKCPISLIGLITLKVGNKVDKAAS